MPGGQVGQLPGELCAEVGDGVHVGLQQADVRTHLWYGKIELDAELRAGWTLSYGQVGR